MADISAYISAIPVLAGFSAKQAQRLGGLTNLVYRLGDSCLRIPGDGTEEYIDRKAEAIAARAAARAGVSPEVLYFDAETGVMVTRFVNGTTTMTPDGFAQRDSDGSMGRVKRVAQALRQLHNSGAEFSTRFELFSMIDDYLKLLSTKDVALPDGYHDIVKEAGAVRTALAQSPVPAVACHCDPLCENFLDTGTRMWIVDWEYSGMNDPMWDLGDLSVEAGFSDAQDDVLLNTYFDGTVRAQDRGRMVIYKAMCDLLWTLWGLIQLANENPAEDFRAYADGRFARCKALMHSPDFAGHLKAITS
jgi:thiamine kinase-like enzyme